MSPNNNLFDSLHPMESIESLSHQLPPGFRFHPTDEELINEYLRNKITSSVTQFTSIIAGINIYKYNPWDLPAKAFFGDEEWFFFSPRDRKYPNGARPNRSAASGYWKATGTDKPILDSSFSHCIGVKKALVFYKGRPPKGIKTEWVMHEYRLLDPTFNQLKNKDSMRLDDWVLCRIRQKSYSGSVDDKQGNQKMEMQEGSDCKLYACYDNNNNNNNNNNRINEQEVGNNLVGETQPFEEVIDTVKRKFSFGAVDELLMLPESSKRVNYGGSQIEEFSLFGFDFVDQEFAGLLM